MGGFGVDKGSRYFSVRTMFDTQKEINMIIM